MKLGEKKEDDDKPKFNLRIDPKLGEKKEDSEKTKSPNDSESKHDIKIEERDIPINQSDVNTIPDKKVDEDSKEVDVKNEDQNNPATLVKNNSTKFTGISSGWQIPKKPTIPNRFSNINMTQTLTDSGSVLGKMSKDPNDKSIACLIKPFSFCPR